MRYSLIGYPDSKFQGPGIGEDDTKGGGGGGEGGRGRGHGGEVSGGDGREVPDRDNSIFGG